MSSQATEQDSAEQPQQPFIPRKRRIPCSQMDMAQRLEYALDNLGFVKQSMHTYQSIDFCLDEIGKIDWLCYFTGLKELTIVNNSVTEIEGIDKCKLLEKIWLSANCIETIRCFEYCTSLKYLYLSSNKIKQIRGLDTLIGLQRLWLDGNLIEHLDGLSQLSNLVELNLADNNIENIGVSLDSLQVLKDLNLSGNRIGSFKEILNLNRLPQLEACNFNDPNYGDNPICHLCNYSTYVLFHLPQLSRLDMKYITDEEKSFSESTFMKKRMYYNMRIKTIQRNTTNVIRLLKICKNLKKKKIEIQVDKIIRRLQEIEREMDERNQLPASDKSLFQSMCTYGPNKEASNPLDLIETEELIAELEQKKAFVLSLMKKRDGDVKVSEALFESTKKKIYEISEQNISRLITELDTGGNIRFEEGRQQDKWYTSCVDLVRSRFNAESMSHLGIYGISVTRVTRIHNRYLRNRFDDKLEQLVDLTDPSYKRNLEYLFYGQNPAAPKEMHKAMEEGFRSTEDYESAGLPGCVALVNSVASAEIPRLNQLIKFDASPTKKEKKSLKNGEVTPIPSGQILVCKIFLQKCVQDMITPFFYNNMSPGDIWRQSPVDHKSYQGIQSVYRVMEKDQKQRMWFVMDHGLALPEYLVDFDFNTTQQAYLESKRLQEVVVLNDECNLLFQGVVQAQSILESKISVAQNIKDGAETQSRQVVVPLTYQDLDRSDMSCIKKLLHQFMTTCHVKELMDNHYEFVDDEVNTKLENATPPEIPLRSQFNQISEHIIVNISRQQDFTKITYLNLFNNCIRKIQNLDQLVNLKTLILSFNQIDQIQGLNANSALTRLDLNHNFIRVIENLGSQSLLESIDLRHNWITEESQIKQLAIACPNLKILALKSNPIANDANYRSLVFTCFSNLGKLDDLKKKDKDRAANSTDKEMSQEMILTAVKAMKKVHLFDSNNEMVSEWQRSIESLDLSHMKISKILELQSFSGLRKLILLDNKIQQISGLEGLKCLEELNLEKNKISQIINLESLKSLKKLDLGSNLIKRIQNLSQLTALTQLSLENNKIVRMDGLEDLSSLMELYIDNNLVVDIQEVMKLKDLPRLIILDCSCNPIANNRQDYRIFCIFTLRKLRVLDGISIDPQEHLEAKETFSGRLTDEMLTLRLQGRRLQDVRDLDLSNCKLKDFDDMFDNQKLPQIRELNLSGNMMASLKAIGHLPSLKILRLRGNRIETLFCKPPIQDDKTFKRGLFGVLNIEFLDVSSNQLQYLYGLQCQTLKNLSVLLVGDNGIAKIEHLEKLKNLRELDLSKNKIRQLDPKCFYAPSLLTTLRLDDNALKQLIHIEQLDKLQVLSVSGTRISEFMELERCSDLAHLIEVSFISTPLIRKPQYRLAVLKRLPLLEVLDGKEIPQEEKRRVEIQVGGGVSNHPIQISAPNIHFQAYPPAQSVKPTVKVSTMDFSGLSNNHSTPQGQPRPLQEQYNVQAEGRPQPVETLERDVRISNTKRPQTKTNSAAVAPEMQRSNQQQKYLDKPQEPLYQPSQFSNNPQYLQGLVGQGAPASTTVGQKTQPRSSRQASSQQPQGTNQLQPPLLQMQISSLQQQQAQPRVGGLPLGKR